MKTTVDILEKEIIDVIRFTGAKTNTEAVTFAVQEYNRQARLTRLADKLGTFENFISPKKLHQLRSES